MTKRTLPRIPLLASSLAALFLGACTAANSPYPALTMRAAEKAALAPSPLTPPKEDSPAPAPDRSAVIAQITRKISASYARFDSKLDRASRLAAAARGSGKSSNAMGEALIAYGEAESARVEVSGIAAQLDEIYAEAALNGEISPELDEAKIATKISLSAMDKALQHIGANLPR